MSQIDDMIISVLESGERLISETIRDRVKARFGVQHFQNYITKRLSFLIQDGVVESRYVLIDGEKKNYCEYCLRKVMGYPVNVVKGGKKLTDGDIVLGAPNYVKIEKRCWRQSDAPCPKCGSNYEEKNGGKWVCNKCV
jgi:hypothetical protein